MKNPAGAIRRGSFLACGACQHFPPCIAVSVQLAAEFTSAAAPRTVLHPAIVSDATTNTAATIFWTIIAPPLDTGTTMNHRNGCLSTEPLVALLSVHRILGAIRDRVHVFRSAANGVASRQHQRGADQHHGRRFPEHSFSPHL
jgi:hypothetical protein